MLSRADDDGPIAFKIIENGREAGELSAPLLHGTGCAARNVAHPVPQSSEDLAPQVHLRQSTAHFHKGPLLFAFLSLQREKGGQQRASGASHKTVVRGRKELLRNVQRRRYRGHAAAEVDARRDHLLMSKA